MKLSQEEVRKIARLARLEPSSEELEMYTSQLSKILEYVERLNQLDVSAIEPTAHAVSVPTPYRKDEIQPFQGQEEVLSQAPDRDDRFFRVPKVI